jgi:hypothetical protein
MTRRAALRWSILGTIVPVVLLLPAAARPVAASCGDYVHVLPPGPSPAVGSPAGLTAPLTERRPAAPCDCPGCHHAPDMPLAPVAPPTTAPPNDAALPAAPPPRPVRVERLRAEPGPLPLPLVTSIFHPPRA